jgi:hypothetical protein
MTTVLTPSHRPVRRSSDDSPHGWPVERVIRSQTHLALSGSRVVRVFDTVTGRCSFEVYHNDGELLAVVSDSPLDRGVLRGGWRGKLSDKRSNWALVVGRMSPNLLSVTFKSRWRKTLATRFVVASDLSDEFWVLEAATHATHAIASMSGRPVSRVQLLRLN